MAKKENNVLNEDFDIDYGLEEFSFDYDEPVIKDDRKPIIKAMSGAIAGAKEHLSSSGFIKDAIKEVLPTGFGNAIDIGDEVNKSVKDIYKESIADIKPVFNQAKQAIVKLIPAESKVIPKRVKTLLSDWKKEIEEQNAYKNVDPALGRDAMIATTLQDMFKSEEETRIEEKAHQDGKDRLNEGIALIRHRSLLDAANRSAISLSRLDSYQTRVTLNYQRKSLELQYRGLFATQDLLTNIKLDSVKRDSILLAIAKNTALPEYVKIKDSEARKQIVKNKLYDKVATALYGDKHDFIGKTIKNVKDRAMGSLKEFTSGLQEGISQAEMMHSMSEGMEIDPATMAGNVAGSMGANALGLSVARWGKSKLEGSSLDKRFGITDKAHAINKHIENLPNHISELKRTNKYAMDDSIFSMFMTKIQDLLPGSGIDKKTVQITGKDMDSPFHLTRFTDRSINKIIPGYLARIFRELQITRTGNTKIKLTEFDHDAGRFTGSDKLAERIIKKVMPENTVRRLGSSLDNIVRDIDPENKLTPEQQDILRKKLLVNSNKRNYANKARLGNAKQYDGVKKEHAEIIAKHMSEYLDKLTPEQAEKFAVRHNALSDHVGHPGEIIQQHLDLGNKAELKKLGLIDESGNIDDSKIIDHYLAAIKKTGKGRQDEKSKYYGGLGSTPWTDAIDGAREKVFSHIDGLKDKYKKAKEAVKDSPASKNLNAQADKAKSYGDSFIKATTSNVDDLVGKTRSYMIPHFNNLKTNYENGTLKEHLTTTASDIKTNVARENLEKGKDIVSSAIAGGKAGFKNLITATPVATNTIAKVVANAAKKTIGADDLSKDISNKQKLLANLKETRKNVSDYSLDLYIPGESAPRVYGAKLAAGEYFDAKTGKVIKTLSGITGAVIDKANQIVITSSEVPQLNYFSPVTKTFESIKTVNGVAANFVNGQVSALRDIGNKQINLLRASMVSKAKEFASNLVDDGRPKDVYVDGEDLPRLTGIEIEKGSYIDAETGKPISSENDITGAVKDTQGKIMIARDDLPKLKFFNVTLRRWSPLWIAKKIAGGLWHFQTKVAPGMAARNLKRLWSATKMAAGFAKSLLTGTGRTLGLVSKKPKDVYVRGDDKEPRLIGYKFTEGAYIDRDTKKHIWSENEIEGPVADAITNETLIDVDDLDKLYTLDSFLGKYNPLKLAGWIAKAPFRASKFLLKAGINFTKTTGLRMAKGGLKLLGRAASSTGKALLTGLGLRLPPQDVYVNGAEGSTIALTGVGMKSGQYVSAATGKTIESPSDIDGDVKDRDTEQVILTKGQIEEGIFTSKGRMIKLGKLKSFLTKGFTTLKKILNPKVKTTLKVNVKDKALSQTETASIRSAITLDKILDAIKNFGNKDKVRKGSYADEIANEAKEKADGAKNKNANLFAKTEAAKAEAKNNKDAKEKEGGGFFDKALELGKSALGMGGAGAAGATIAGGAAAAETVATGTAVAAGGGGLLATIGSGALTTASVIGGGLLTALSSPVVIGAGALALAAYGGYRLFKNATRGNVSTLNKIRMVQYGFAADDTDNIKKCVDLESQLSSHIVVKNGSVVINFKDIDKEKIVSSFDLDPKDKKQNDLFFNWFRNRFQPIYITHLTAINALTGKADLSKIDDLKSEEKKKFVDAVKFPDGPYSVTALPILKEGVTATTAKDVQLAVKNALDEIDGKKVEDKQKTSGLVSSVSNALLPTAAAATLPTTLNNNPNDPQQRLQDNFVKAVSTIGTETMPDGSRINAFDTIRYKAYGLTKLESDKIKSLQLLEAELIKSVNYDGNSKASWNGNSIAILNKLKGSFGIADVFSPEANDWTRWFADRFLPVFMAYLSAIKVATGKPLVGDPISLLKPEQVVVVAKAIIGLGNIWRIKYSPWPKYIVNLDSSSTDENLAFLQRLVKNAEMAEQKANAAPVNKNAPVVAATKPPVPPTIASTANLPNIATAAPSPDVEASVSGTSAATAGGVGTGLTGKLKLADGPIYDGRNAQAFLTLGKNVSLDGLNPAVKTNVMGMIEEYGTLTGKSTQINDGFRTTEQQAALKEKYGARAAAPGSSLHEFGLALDIDSKTLNEMDELGLMRKYGFTRPVGSEPWHMEPIGIQSDITKYKQDAASATKAIEASVMRGGGGIGTLDGARKYSRDRDSSIAIANANITPSSPNTPAAGKTTSTLPAGNLAVAANTPPAPTIAPTPIATLGSVPNTNAGSSIINSQDSEIKPSASLPGLTKAISPTPTLSASSAPADPSVKVPDPKGVGVEGLKDTVTAAAKMVGVDPNEMLAFAGIESAFNPNAKAAGSSAAGLFQFTNDTWHAMLAKYGNKYGYSAATTLPTDAKAASIMGAHYLKEITDTLGKKIKRAVGVTEGYLGHFLGPGGATSFLTDMDNNPNAPAAPLMPKAANSNPSIFFDGNRPRSFTEIYSLLAKRLQDKAKAFGITLPATPTAPASAANTSPTADTSSGYVGSVTANAAPFSPAPKKAPVATLGAGTIGTSNYMPSPAVNTAPQEVQNSVPSMGNAYGFSTPQASVTTMPSVGSKLDASIMTNTENILTQQLSVQQQLLDIATKMFGLASSNKTTSSTNDSSQPNEPMTNTTQSSVQPPAPYQIPRAPISMKRTASRA